jgi:hypothetical protein
VPRLGGTLLGRQRRGVFPPPGSGTPFTTPAAMTGIQGWYDFSTLAGVDGSAIASIADGSANARTASQATGANQPLVKAGANGSTGSRSRSQPYRKHTGRKPRARAVRDAEGPAAGRDQPGRRDADGAEEGAGAQAAAQQLRANALVV